MNSVLAYVSDDKKRTSGMAKRQLCCLNRCFIPVIILAIDNVKLDFLLMLNIWMGQEGCF